MRRHRKQGATLTEVMIATAVLGIAFMLGKVGMDMVNNLATQGHMVEVQREAQNLLYQMVRDIRNAEFYANPSSTTLTIQMLNPELGFDEPDLFDPDNLGTVTYALLEDNGDNIVRRTANFPAFTTGGGQTIAARTHSDDFLRKYIITPVLGDSTTWLFVKNDDGDIVFISLNLADVGMKKKALRYTATSMKRAYRDQG